MQITHEQVQGYMEALYPYFRVLVVAILFATGPEQLIEFLKE